MNYQGLVKPTQMHVIDKRHFPDPGYVGYFASHMQS